MKVRWSDAFFGMQLRLAEEKLTDSALEIMDEEAEKIREAAIEGAPILHGYLENAIERSDIYDEGGERSVAIGIDQGATNASGKSVEKYGGNLEKNQIAPVPTSFTTGTINRGPLTEWKGGGGAFIQLAVHGRVGVTASRIKAALKRAIREAGAAVKKGRKK